MVTEEGNIEKFQVLSINHLPLQTNCVHPSKVIKEITTFAMRTLSRVFASKDSMESDDLFFGMPGEKLLPVSERLTEDLKDIEVFLGSHATVKSSCRLRITTILMDCIRNERALLSSQPDATTKQPSLTLETRLEVTRKTKDLGRSTVDYSIWYDRETMGTGLAVVEIGGGKTFDQGFSQCLAYMSRFGPYRPKDNPNCEQDATVYGAITDGYRFTFLRIDNNSNWAKSSTVFWNKDTASLIYTLLRLIVRRRDALGVLSSPSKAKKMIQLLNCLGARANPVEYRLQFRSSVGSGWVTDSD